MTPISINQSEDQALDAPKAAGRVGRLSAHMGSTSARVASFSSLLTQASLTIDGYPIEPKAGVDQAKAEKVGKWLIGASFLAPVAFGALAFGLPGALLLGVANLVAANIPGQASIFAVTGVVALFSKSLSLTSKAVDYVGNLASKIGSRRQGTPADAPPAPPLSKASL